MIATDTFDHLIADLDEFGYEYAVVDGRHATESAPFAVAVVNVPDGGRDLVERLLHLDVRVTPRSAEGAFLVRWNPTPSRRRAVQVRDGWETRNA